MRLRRDMGFGIKLAACGLLSSLFVAASPPLAGMARGASPAEVAGELATRVATYQNEAGESYFAASIQPPADKALLNLLSQGPARVSIVVDTSASQVGAFRKDQLAMLRGILAGLRPSDQVQLFAADVSVAPLSELISATDQSAITQALAKLSRRLPLGHTNLNQALQTAQTALRTGPQDETRSLIYIGDGASMELAADEAAFESLVDSLRADRIAVHSVAIGPTKNVALLATLANQTGGELAMVADGQADVTSQLGKQVAAAATLSPIWVEQVSLPAGLETIQAKRLPPLRLDRDSLLFGTAPATQSAADAPAATGTIEVIGKSARGNVVFTADATIEANHPDFSFLPGMVSAASSNGGLLLPTAGSPLLREAARTMAARADELAVAGEVALRTGSQRGAQAIAKMALESDPNNLAARRLQERSEGDRLVVQNQEDPFADPPAAQPAAAAPAQPGPGATPPPAPRAPAPRGPAVEPQAAVPPQPRAAAPAPRVRRGDLMEEPSGLLGDVAAARAQEAGRLRATTRAQLLEARRRLETNPIGVSASLKLLLTQIENQPNVDPQVRQELLGQIRSAIASASRREAAAIEAEARAAQIAAAATQTELLLQETFRREEQLRTLSNQLNSLINEGRLRFADSEITPAIEQLAKGTVFSNQALLETQMLNSSTRMLDLRLRRERNYLDALALVEESNIPFVDDQPLKYPDADVWQRLSRRRLERYGSTDLIGSKEVERRISAALDDEVTYSFVEETLENALRIIAEDRVIPILLDRKALEDTPFTPDTPVNLSLSNVSLRSFLRLMLREYELTYMVNDEVLQITTPEMAELNPKTKIYAVGDLVVPPINLGGMGGMGGGMGGGMMGGMGGMGGGMGMMAVPDDVSLAAKSSAAAAPQGPTATEAPSAPETSSAPTAEPIRLGTAQQPASLEDWLSYFEALELDGPEAVELHDQQVLATAAQLNSRVKLAETSGDKQAALQAFAAVRDFLGAAILSGNVQPWMYHAYALSLKATGADLQEIERAYLSAVDFADSPEEVLLVADQLRRAGCDAAALRLCQNVTSLQPYRREAYVMGMRLAEKLDDVEAMQWACRGILGQAWPKGAEKVEADARLLARALHQRLVQEGKSEAAKQFMASLQAATAHDLVVRVSWTGDADIDVAVEEPSGTVCSSETPLSPAGGTFLGDSFPGMESAEDGGTLSETYVCPQGYSGVYRILVRRVWGNVSTGHVTVDILADVGRPTQRYIHKQLELTEKDALIEVDVQAGTRKSEVGEAQLAHLRDAQLGGQPKFLAQFLGGSDSSALQQYLADLARMGMLNSGGVGAGRGPFGLNPAVGFRPEITTLPEGANMMAMAIISADRRYVRISPAPMFSQIGDVNTFNFVDGESGESPGGAGGGFGGIGGGGIGGGGGFGGGGFGN